MREAWQEMELHTIRCTNLNRKTVTNLLKSHEPHLNGADLVKLRWERYLMKLLSPLVVDAMPRPILVRRPFPYPI